MKLSDSDIKQMQTYFSGKPVIKAFIFGSYARNTATENSDIDILVEFDYSQHIGLGFVSMKEELENMLHKSVDLVSEKALSKRILPFANLDKQLIYERKVS